MLLKNKLSIFFEGDIEQETPTLFSVRFDFQRKGDMTFRRPKEYPLGLATCLIANKLRMEKNTESWCIFDKVRLTKIAK